MLERRQENTVLVSRQEYQGESEQDYPQFFVQEDFLASEDVGKGVVEQEPRVSKTFR